ncbi:MAG: hypothetical protein ACI4RA_06390 [Kiritimatiellia bacterium]
MSRGFHRFPVQQEAYLRALKGGAYRNVVRPSRGPRSVSLVDRMPPVYQQALRGTCVANAVTALLEYYGDCLTRLSVQFLHAATKEIEREGLERNLRNLREGRPLDAGFESVCHAELLQLRMLADVNGGMDACAVRPYLARFEEGVRERFAQAPGSLLMSAFHAVETVGVCRYALWPYAMVQAAPLFGAGGEEAKFPPGTREDAAKRRIVHGLYLLSAPNNVDEIRGILAGANHRRAMPVAVTVDFFEGCDGEDYAFPAVEEDAEGHLVAKNKWLGRHGLLIVGYEDNASEQGGGCFLIRNSLGEGWGRGGYGRLPYAYLECFALEAGTILQDLVDYEGDGYDGQRRTAKSAVPLPRKGGRGRMFLLNLGVALALVGATIAVGFFWGNFFHRRPKPEVPVSQLVPVVGQSPDQPSQVTRVTVYKVFFSCENAEERKALRTALASEGVSFPVEFMPQNLETVLAVRVTMPDGNASDAIMKVLEQYYSGPRKEFWTDVAGLSRSRSIYIVKDSMRRWNGGLE